VVFTLNNRATGETLRAIWFFGIPLAWVLGAALLTWITAATTGRAPMVFFIIAVIMSSMRGTVPGLSASAFAFCAVLLWSKEIFSSPLASRSMVALFVLISLVVNLAFHKVHRKNAELILTNAALMDAKAAMDGMKQQLLQHAVPGTETDVDVQPETERLPAINSLHFTQ
jgi:hypothetical protein